MFKCCYPGFATFLRFKHHNSFSNQRLHFRKTLGTNGSTKGTNAGEVLIQVSSRLRTRRISEENEFTCRTRGEKWEGMDRWKRALLSPPPPFPHS